VLADINVAAAHNNCKGRNIISGIPVAIAICNVIFDEHVAGYINSTPARKARDTLDNEPARRDIGNSLTGHSGRIQATTHIEWHRRLLGNTIKISNAAS